MINQYGQFIPDYPGQQYYQDPSYMRYMAQQHQQNIDQRRNVDITQFPCSHKKLLKEMPFDDVEKVV